MPTLSFYLPLLLNLASSTSSPCGLSLTSRSASLASYVVVRECRESSPVTEAAILGYIHCTLWTNTHSGIRVYKNRPQTAANAPWPTRGNHPSRWPVRSSSIPTPERPADHVSVRVRPFTIREAAQVYGLYYLDNDFISVSLILM